MGRVEGPAISGVAIHAEREGTGLVMVEVVGDFSVVVAPVAGLDEAGRAMASCLSFPLTPLFGCRHIFHQG